MPAPNTALGFLGIVLSLCTSAIFWGSTPVACGRESPAGPVEIELDDLRPGLVAAYRSALDKDAALTRVDPKPAFYLGHSSPYPRIAPGPFEATWSGVLLLKETAPVSFDAYVGGQLKMDIDGVTVLQGRGESDSAHLGPGEALNRPPGVYRLRIEYRSLPHVAARLQIWWHGANFGREPLPAWQLKHLAGDISPDGRRESLAAQGRTAVARLGCAHCHRDAFPGVTDPPPGPALADLGRRVGRAWLLRWLDDPAKLRPGAHMPLLFSAGRQGFVERWAVTEYLTASTNGKRTEAAPAGDHRAGRMAFVSIGCVACHCVPDLGRGEQPELDRFPLVGLADRMTAEDLAAFIGNPHGRYPDGRMPRLPLTPNMPRDIAAYLLLWSKPMPIEAPAWPPAVEEIETLARRLKVRDARAAGAALIHEKRCAACHAGIEPKTPANVPLGITDNSRGCLSGTTLPRFSVDAPTLKAINAYRAVAAREKHASPFESRRRLVERSGCLRCHQRDTDQPSPLEQAGSTLGGAFLQSLPFQRVPRLTNPYQKYTPAYLASAVREGVSGLRPASYSYRMPVFGHEAEALVQALAEGDGELPAKAEPPSRAPADPTIAPLAGPSLAGFSGYACVSCHVWNGRMLSDPDPGAVGPDLTKVSGRIRRDWFDRFLEDPARFHPGTPMPAIFLKGRDAPLQSLLDGDAARQKDALWAYFALGKNAPSPKPPTPLPVTAPATNQPPIVAQIPIHLPGGGVVESISILYGNGDLLIYDAGSAALHSLYTAAQILRSVQGRARTFTASGTPVGAGFTTDQSFRLAGAHGAVSPRSLTFHGYDRLADGAGLRWQAQFSPGDVEVSEVLRIVPDGNRRHLSQQLRFTGVPAGCSLELHGRALGSFAVPVMPIVGGAKSNTDDKVFHVTLTPDTERKAAAEIRYELPAARAAPVAERTVLFDPGRIEGSLERPGYRAVAYPRPKLATGEDLVMPAALAVHPRDGRVFVASLKMGEIFVLRDSSDDGRAARFDNYAHGLFQDALSLLAEEDALYVLHRRNLTRISESQHNGVADRFDRVFVLPHGVADSYDYGYGLVRDKIGAFVISFAPYANTRLPGSGGALRLMTAQKPKEVAFGLRNPLGWCTGPEGEVFFTDNQGEWVATNKLCHLVDGRYYGFPNPAQRQHRTKPFGKPAVWVPYGWARSINGVTYDNSGGKFGPFAGQFFLAELMYGGAIIRANVEKVNGEYQGACFPFCGKGLLGPLTLAFDPRGRLFVGGITEPGWMAQPDRGALYRIDFTGQVPFEMQSIHVRPRGFQVVFTTPVVPESARDPASYQIEHYRYEYTGAYGSPELDRTRVPIEQVEVAADGLSVKLTTAPLVKDRVYLISPEGVRSTKGEPLVHQTGAYTLHEVPGNAKN